MRQLRICLLSPWYGGSHKRWADGLKAASKHSIEIFGLPAKHWKWRMHGAAVTLAKQVLTSPGEYDLVLADDMMDVAVLSALLKGGGINVPVCTYFHENQLCYPVSPRDTDVEQGRDQHYGYTNFTSALASDFVYFNSRYHMGAFLSSLEDFLARLPDGDQRALVPGIQQKSKVLPLGMDLGSLEAFRGTDPKDKASPLIIWNHRWEYDKGPEQFLDLLLDLKAANLSFTVALLGERGSNCGQRMSEVRAQLGERIVWNGMVEDFCDYARWLWAADIAPVTAVHDFFGGSVVEAMYCDCHTLLPNRLAYPEHVSHGDFLYDSYHELFDKVENLIVSGDWRQTPDRNTLIRKYDWTNLASTYDQAFCEVVGAGNL